MKLLLLVNPAAGKKRGDAVARKALDVFHQHGVEIESCYSEYPGHLIKVAEREVNGDWDGIVAVGGDGTLFEVINGMMRSNTDLPIPLGVIPVGTGNSFSRDLTLSSFDDAIRNILNGKTREIDLGKCVFGGDEFYFINILGFGFVADVARKASYYRNWGALSYVIGVFIITIKLKTYLLEFEIDGKSYRRDNIFVEICNSTKTGGDMIMAPEAKIDDGMLNVVILNKTSRLRLLSALPKIFKGTHIFIPEVETFTGRDMTFRPVVPKVLTPDGEIIGNTPITVSVVPKKIRVFDA
ncbi:diacylglycerol kinase family lipid kinase [candidate division KSB1 bacterium]|nr:diacylglycerol kinase family lipid kinase [candidate division KSB1 bacterium]